MAQKPAVYDFIHIYAHGCIHIHSYLEIQMDSHGLIQTQLLQSAPNADRLVNTHFNIPLPISLALALVLSQFGCILFAMLTCRLHMFAQGFSGKKVKFS